MILDTATVNLVTILMVILECGILGALWAIHRDVRGVGHWALGALSICAGVLGIFLRDSLPPAISIVLTNIAILCGYALTWWGLDLFFGRRPQYALGLALLVAGIAGIVPLGIVAPDTRLRLALLLLLMAVFVALRARSMLRRILPETRFSQLLGGTVMVLQVACDLILLAAVIRSDGTPRPLSHMPVSGWIFLVLLVLSVANVYAAVLLVSQKLQGRLRETAQRDQLTGTWRRDALEEAGTREIARSRRHRRPLALLLLDLDHFKAINDRFGHQAGDEALRRFAVTAAACLRREDLFGRTGGEEFCILLPDTDEGGALRLAERIRTAIADLPLAFDGHPLHLTVSIGIALADGRNDWDSLARAADVALYRAKSEGRNRIAVAALPAG